MSELSRRPLLSDGIALQREQWRQRWRAEGFHGDETIADLATAAAGRSPQTRLRFASADRPGTLRLDVLIRRARTVAGGLAQAGVKHRDRVAVQVPNWEEAAIAYVAVAMLGAVIVPIVHIYGSSDTDWILRDARPAAFIGVASWGEIDHAERVGSMPGLEGVATFLIGQGRPRGTKAWEELEAGPEWRGTGAAKADDPAVLIYTSGTTGTPKCVVHSHNSIRAELATMPSPPLGVGVTVALQPWPAGHIGGLTAMLGPLVHGIDTILIDRWDTDQVLDLLVSEHVTAMSGVPATLLRLLDRTRGSGLNLPLRITTGGAGVPAALIEQCEAAGWKASRCYGSSEHPSATGGRSHDGLAARAGTDGAPLGGTQVRVVDEGGRQLPHGADGEIQLVGPDQFLGYASAEANKSAFTDDGWYRSGDIGNVDGDGRLTVTDRISDIVNRGGEKISSAEVENVLLRLAGVAEVAVVASPDLILGERVCAVIRLSPGAPPPSIEDLGRHFRIAGVARQKTPERIVIVDDFPRTASGKIRKADLRARFSQ
jgi:acyl-CoA synthetase (AMP-forming)/AMP-acid ligase II